MGRLLVSSGKRFLPVMKGDPGEERPFPSFTGIVESEYDAGYCFFCLLIMKRNITV